MSFCVNRCSSVHDAPMAEGRWAVGLAYGTKNVPFFLLQLSRSLRESPKN